MVDIWHFQKYGKSSNLALPQACDIGSFEYFVIHFMFLPAVQRQAPAPGRTGNTLFRHKLAQGI